MPIFVAYQPQKKEAVLYFCLFETKRLNELKLTEFNYIPGFVLSLHYQPNSGYQSAPGVLGKIH